MLGRVTLGSMFVSLVLSILYPFPPAIMYIDDLAKALVITTARCNRLVTVFKISVL